MKRVLKRDEGGDWFLTGIVFCKCKSVIVQSKMIIAWISLHMNIERKMHIIRNVVRVHRQRLQYRLMEWCLSAVQKCFFYTAERAELRERKILRVRVSERASELCRQLNWAYCRRPFVISQHQKIITARVCGCRRRCAVLCFSPYCHSSLLLWVFNLLFFNELGASGVSIVRVNCTHTQSICGMLLEWSNITERGRERERVASCATYSSIMHVHIVSHRAHQLIGALHPMHCTTALNWEARAHSRIVIGHGCNFIHRVCGLRVWYALRIVCTIALTLMIFCF